MRRTVRHTNRDRQTNRQTNKHSVFSGIYLARDSSSDVLEYPLVIPVVSLYPLSAFVDFFIGSTFFRVGAVEAQGTKSSTPGDVEKLLDRYITRDVMWLRRNIDIAVYCRCECCSQEVSAHIPWPFKLSSELETRPRIYYFSAASQNESLVSLIRVTLELKFLFCLITEIQILGIKFLIVLFLKMFLILSFLVMYLQIWSIA